jgi:uncharacterized protein (DUF849 family)
LGGRARVRLEDSLYIKQGEPATSNAQQVLKVRTIIEALGLKLRHQQVRGKLLKLKGKE